MTSEASTTALKCAADQALKSAGILPSTFRVATARLEEDHQEYGRVAYLIDSRRVKLRTAGAKGTRKSQVRPRPDPRSVNPWQADPNTLGDETRTVAVCPGCEGTKKTICPTCSGAESLCCDGCGGRGQVMGQRGPKNCPSCRGKGTRRCDSCKGRGTVKCGACEGLGRVWAWLEVDAERFTQVKASPTTGLALLHAELEIGQDFDRDPSLYPVPLLSDTGWVSLLPVGPDPSLAASLDPVTDRLVSQRLQIFGSTIYHCHYELLTGSGDVQVSGRPLQVLPGSEWSPWRRRRWAMLGVGGATFLLALGYFSLYTGRAEWYARHPSSGLLSILGLLSALLSVVWAAGMTLPRSAWTWARFRIPALLTSGAWAWMLLLWLAIHPTAEGVHASLLVGDLKGAHREASALQAVEGASEPLSAVLVEIETAEAEQERERRQALDEEHIERVKHARSTVLAAEQLAMSWEFLSAQQAALGVVLEGADEEIETLHKLHDGDGLRKLAEAIEPHDPDRATRASARAALAEIYFCQRRDDFDCISRVLKTGEPLADDEAVVVAREDARQKAISALRARLTASVPGKKTPLEERERILTTMLDDAQAFAELTDEEPPINRPKIEYKFASVQKAIEKQREKEEAVRERERHKAERAARREVKRVARQEARRQARSQPRRRTCCKYCSKGTPCGDTCISARKTCHTGPGCAC